MTTPPLLSVIVVAYGETMLLRECVSSIEQARARVEGETEVVVVLNRGSADVRHELESVDYHLVVPDHNLGFAGGVSAGIERARGEWIALVNDDCVVEPGALNEMLSVAGSSSQIGSVAAKVLFAEPDDRINSAGIEIDQLGIAYERRLGEPGDAGEAEPVDVFGASGTAALYRREMLDAIGGFDESFFAYLEDADVAWRAQMLGWRCIYAPAAVVRHHHSMTLGHRSAEKYFLVGRNRVRMLAKNATRSQLLRRVGQIVLYDLAYVVFVAVKARTLAPLRGRARGLRDWRAYRAAGRVHRTEANLAPSQGIRGAFRRDLAYG